MSSRNCKRLIQKAEWRSRPIDKNVFGFLDGLMQMKYSVQVRVGKSHRVFDVYSFSLKKGKKNPKPNWVVRRSNEKRGGRSLELDAEVTPENNVKDSVVCATGDRLRQISRSWADGEAETGLQSPPPTFTSRPLTHRECRSTQVSRKNQKKKLKTKPGLVVVVVAFTTRLLRPFFVLFLRFYIHYGPQRYNIITIGMVLTWLGSEAKR